MSDDPAHEYASGDPAADQEYVDRHQAFGEGYD